MNFEVDELAKKATLCAVRIAIGARLILCREAIGFLFLDCERAKQSTLPYTEFRV